MPIIHIVILLLNDILTIVEHQDFIIYYNGLAFILDKHYIKSVKTKLNSTVFTKIFFKISILYCLLMLIVFLFFPFCYLV